MKITKKVLECIEDDVQLKIDNFFERVSSYLGREARLLKEEEIRAVCVDYPHVPAETIQEIYGKLIKESFTKDNLKHYVSKWQASVYPTKD